MEFTSDVMNSSEIIDNSLNIAPFGEDFNLKFLIQQTIIGVLTFSLTMWTVLGNMFILFAISTNKTLKATGISNYLVG